MQTTTVTAIVWKLSRCPSSSRRKASPSNQRPPTELMEDTPFTGPNDFVFCSGDPAKPIDHKTIYEVLYKAFAAIGITEGERRRRNITFHGWRHYLNTYMRGKVADAKLRRVTGHKTEVMTERYTNFRLEDFDDLAKCQEGMLA